MGIAQTSGPPQTLHMSVLSLKEKPNAEPWIAGKAPFINLCFAITL